MNWEEVPNNVASTKTKLIHEPVTVCMADVEAQEVEWLWPGRVPLGKLTSIVGDPGLGKSMLTLDMAARVSSGREWPDRPGEHIQAGGVLLLSGEDEPADTLKPRLLAAGADCKRVVVLQGWRTVREDGSAGEREHAVDLSRLDIIEQAIGSVDGCKLVVIDPVSCFLGKVDENKNAEVRALLAGLAALAGRRRLAIVVVTHMRKTAGKAIYSALGSLAFTAAPRACWAVARDPENPDESRLFLSMKMNLTRDIGGLKFKIEGGKGNSIISWSKKPVNLRADDVLGEEGTAGRRRGAAQERAEEFLRQALADGPRQAGQLETEAKTAGISGSSLDRAARDLKVTKTKGRRGEPWIWSLKGVRSIDHSVSDAFDAFDSSPGDSPEDLQWHQRHHSREVAGDVTPLNGRELGDDSEEVGA